MKLFIEITEISFAEAITGETTQWGTRLDGADSFAWEAPMLGGGAGSKANLSSHLVRYAGLHDLDPMDGPDECVFVENGQCYHALITVE